MQTSLEITRQQLLESAGTDENVAAGILIFKVARELVPLPISMNPEPTRYSTSSAKG